MRREGRAQIFPLKTSAGEGRWRSKHFCFGVKTGRNSSGLNPVQVRLVPAHCSLDGVGHNVPNNGLGMASSPPPAGRPESELSSRHPQVFPGSRRSPVSLVEGVNACQNHQNSQSEP